MLGERLEDIVAFLSSDGELQEWWREMNGRGKVEHLYCAIRELAGQRHALLECLAETREDVEKFRWRGLELEQIKQSLGTALDDLSSSNSALIAERDELRRLHEVQLRTVKEEREALRKDRDRCVEALRQQYRELAALRKRLGIDEGDEP